MFVWQISAAKFEDGWVDVEKLVQIFDASRQANIWWLVGVVEVAGVRPLLPCTVPPRAKTSDLEQLDSDPPHLRAFGVLLFCLRMPASVTEDTSLGGLATLAFLHPVRHSPAEWLLLAYEDCTT